MKVDKSNSWMKMNEAMIINVEMKQKHKWKWMQ